MSCYMIGKEGEQTEGEDLKTRIQEGGGAKTKR